MRAHLADGVARASRAHKFEPVASTEAAPSSARPPPQPPRASRCRQLLSPQSKCFCLLVLLLTLVAIADLVPAGADTTARGAKSGNTAQQMAERRGHKESLQAFEEHRMEWSVMDRLLSYGGALVVIYALNILRRLSQQGRRRSQRRQRTSGTYAIQLFAKPSISGGAGPTT